MLTQTIQIALLAGLNFVGATLSACHSKRHPAHSIELLQTARTVISTRCSTAVVGSPAVYTAHRTGRAATSLREQHASPKPRTA